MLRSSTTLDVKRQQKNSETKALIANATSSAVAIGLFFINNGRQLYREIQPLVQCLLAGLVPVRRQVRLAMAGRNSAGGLQRRRKRRGGEGNLFDHIAPRPALVWRHDDPTLGVFEEFLLFGRAHLREFSERANALGALFRRQILEFAEAFRDLLLLSRQ